MVDLPWQFWVVYAYAALISIQSIYRFGTRTTAATIIAVIAGLLWPIALPLHMWAAEPSANGGLELRRRRSSNA